MMNLKMLYLLLILLIAGTSAAQEQSSDVPAGKIVFASFDADGRRDLYMMNADGSNLTQLTEGTEDHYVPMISPDGTQIVYATGLANGRGNQMDLYLMNIDGSNP